MEYKHFLPFVAKYVPDGVLRRSANFNTFLRRESATRLFELADFMMLTLPKPRIDFYKSSDFLDIQRAVTGHVNQVVEALGFFPFRMQLDVLGAMELASQPSCFLV